MNKIRKTCLLLFVLTLTMTAQEKKEDQQLSAATFKGLSFRSVGPAFMSGRIADMAIDPQNEHRWYVAVGSGGVWKTDNAGTTWKPVTDDQPFFSTGCLTLDPQNPATIWLGTGENVGGRHVGIGHGVFVSDDSGQTWEQRGLTKSEHIAKIHVHPSNPQEVLVAVQGPLWSAGGERGLYKTTDAGKTWKRVLYVNEWTGVTDLVVDPRNEQVLYAATWQRHRNVASYMGGGPGTGLYKSTDGGDHWEPLRTGLPQSDMGKIGLAISPMQPDVLYAAIELNRREGAVYRSADRGESWQKMSSTVSGGTGPHYYQELVASPHVFDKIYLMNVRVLVSEDGGKHFHTMKETDKHSDNHAMVFKKDDPNYLLVGTDGGLYESFDDTQTWKFVNNLPLTQFYKVAVDDATPFYNIYGGTQDNNTQGGPSRTIRNNGIVNADWFVLLGGDGHQPATEPGNPNIVYAQSQQGYLHRVDRTTGEAVYIRPHSGIDEPYERFNWDAPVLVSNHDPKRLYFGSQRVWRSDDRGDSWTPVSKDLTLDQERFDLPIMGKKQSWDAAWDVYAMSTYNTLTSLSESPLNEKVLYAGTDDGLIQYTKDGGQTWHRLPVHKLPGVPKTAFVNDIKADLHDINTVYAALDNHKFGDYAPYLYKSTNGGKSWKSISKGIPKNTMVWRLVQDHINPRLLFLATEYGIYVSFDQGAAWTKFSSGLPTISFRDLAIQKRENDLIGASFGRGFYVLDDYSPLRSFDESSLQQEALLFKPRKAAQYQQVTGGTSSQGAAHFKSKNPPYGAVFTYYIGKETTTAATDRIQREKALKKEQKDLPFPGWEALDKEAQESKPKAILVVRNQEGAVIARLKGPLSKGFHRLSWNLKQPVSTVINARKSAGHGHYQPAIFAAPGQYSVSLYKEVQGRVTPLANPQTFEVVRIRENVLTNPMKEKSEDFVTALQQFSQEVALARHSFEAATEKLTAFGKALAYVGEMPGDLDAAIAALKKTQFAIEQQLEGSDAKKAVGEKETPSLSTRMQVAQRGFYGNTYGPTKTQMESLELAKQLFDRLDEQIRVFAEESVPEVERQLREAGAPIIIH
ncbi:MAG: glycosyl hydrolase [Lutibacter sp.]|nr:glycosyl hydrolase [Lutibacter sp.]